MTGSIFWSSNCSSCKAYMLIVATLLSTALAISPICRPAFSLLLPCPLQGLTPWHTQPVPCPSCCWAFASPLLSQVGCCSMTAMQACNCDAMMAGGTATVLHHQCLLADTLESKNLTDGCAMLSHAMYSHALHSCNAGLQGHAKSACTSHTASGDAT